MSTLTALLSVSDKTGIVDLAKSLHALGIKLLSTGGTAKLLADSGLPVTEVADHPFFPVFFCHPTYYLPALVVLEVNVDIGQRNTIGIEKPLEQQVVFQGIDVGDFEAISHHGAGSRTASGTH